MRSCRTLEAWTTIDHITELRKAVHDAGAGRYNPAAAKKAAAQMEPGSGEAATYLAAVENYDHEQSDKQHAGLPATPAASQSAASDRRVRVDSSSNLAPASDRPAVERPSPRMRSRTSALIPANPEPSARHDRDVGEVARLRASAL